jgi:hypothetical protein
MKTTKRPQSGSSVSGPVLELRTSRIESSLVTILLLRSRGTVKYGHESRWTRNQEWLCWRGPPEIYPTEYEAGVPATRLWHSVNKRKWYKIHLTYLLCKQPSAWSENEDANLKTKDVIMCCVVCVISHLMGGCNGGMKIRRENNQRYSDTGVLQCQCPRLRDEKPTTNRLCYGTTRRISNESNN